VFGITAASRNTRFQAARYGLTWALIAFEIIDEFRFPSNIRPVDGTSTGLRGGVRR
jgi:hypothetical protein